MYELSKPPLPPHVNNYNNQYCTANPALTTILTTAKFAVRLFYGPCEIALCDLFLTSMTLFTFCFVVFLQIFFSIIGMLPLYPIIILPFGTQFSHSRFMCLTNTQTCPQGSSLKTRRLNIKGLAGMGPYRLPI